MKKNENLRSKRFKDVWVTSYIKMMGKSRREAENAFKRVFRKKDHPLQRLKID